MIVIDHATYGDCTHLNIGAIGSRQLGGTMVTIMYVIFGFVGCVCVCVLVVVCSRGGWFLGVRRASACAVRHRYFHQAIFFHSSVLVS